VRFTYDFVQNLINDTE
jgi:hypothetical protein